MKRELLIASDHAGYKLKTRIITLLQSWDIAIEDCGTYCDTKPVDYPDYAQIVAHKMRTRADAVAVLICRSGIGMSIAANRFPYIRAGLCHNMEQTSLARQHNDINVLVMPTMLYGQDSKCMKMCGVLLTEEFSHEARHINRVKKLQ